VLPLGLSAPAPGAQSRFADPAAWRALYALENAEGFSAAWLGLMAAKLDVVLAACNAGQSAVLGAFVALRGPEDGRRFLRTASYGDGETSFLLAKAAERCLQLQRNVAQAGGAPNEDAPPLPCQIAVPLMIDDVLEGVVALELAAVAAPLVDTCSRLTQWGAAWFRALLKPRDNDAVRERAELAIEAMAMAAEPGGAASMAQALSTLLAGRMGALRVSFGAGTGARIHVLASSRGAIADNDTDFLLVLAAAMDEAASLGADRPVLFPVPEGQIAAIGAHERLCRAHGAAWAACMVHVAGHRRVAMCVEGTGPAPVPAALAAMAGLNKVMAPLIALRLDAERSLPRHAGALAQHCWRSWVSHAPNWRRAALLAGAGAALFALFARGEHRVAAHATLEGMVKRVLTAPFDGYLAERLVRPGDRIRAGAELARMDIRDLLLQAAEQKGREAESRHQMDDAAGRRDFAGVSVAAARRAQAAAELALVQDNIARASLRAPFDAIVISGDQSETVGVPLRHGDIVYEISPLDRYRVAIDVDETDFAAIATGQAGRLVLSSLSDQAWPFTVERVTPLAAARDGHTVFRVEARLDSNDAMLRPGMQGVAKIDVGRARYVWLWTHAAVNWARLQIWAWL
jgi:hypothetical protein